jgi:hypothetical protein
MEEADQLVWREDLVTAPGSLREAWTSAPRPRWLPAAPGCAPTRLPWPIRSRPPRRCWGSPAASTSWTRSSSGPTSGWRPLVGRAAPRLLELQAIGVNHAGQLLVTAAGQRPERLGGEAAFAHL